jgi:pseudaminic acid synthase
MGNVAFIAEMSGNHGGSLERAHSLVDSAALVGATHFKMQTYTPDSITLDLKEGNYLVSDSHTLWGGKSLYELYQDAHTPYEWHQELFQHARDRGLTPFSTPFDESAVEFLESLDCSIYKIASLEIVDIPLIRKAASTGKPLIISTGTATLDEVDEAVDAARGSGVTDLTLLVCTSDYPADPALANLARIPFLQRRHHAKVGLSDHTIGSHVSGAAIALGATVIEKHLTLDTEDGGVDSAFSATPKVFAEMVRNGLEVFSAIGNENAWGLQGEMESRKHRPSIIATADIRAGELLSSENVATLRPNIGLPPKNFEKVTGVQASRPIFRGQGISWDDL